MSNRGLRTTEFTGNIKALDTDEWKLEVLGAPYGGILGGKDKQGEFFSDRTEFGIEVGGKLPVYYYHGLNPRGKVDALPEIIGYAQASKRDSKGLWFEVTLNKLSDLARRIWESAQKGLAKASTGAVDHLVRVSKESGEILNWTLGELSLIDEGIKRHVANQLAVALPMKANFVVLDSLGQSTKTVEVKVDDGGNYDDIVNQIKSNEQNIGEYTMDNEEKNLTIEEVMNALDAREAAKAAEEASEKELRDTIREEVIKEIEDKIPAWKGGFSVKKLTELGLSNDENESFWHWVKTGDQVAYERTGAVMKALSEGSATAGGYAVPDDFYGQIVAKRDEQSFARVAGARVIQTSRDVLNIPTEGAETTNFVIASEAGAYDEDDVTLAQAAVTIYKFTKMTKVSEELLADQAANLEGFLADDLARKMALTENAYVGVGTGSSQPQGVMVGGTAALTLDGASAITQAEVPELFYKLQGQYRQNASWLMNGTTEGYLRGLTSASSFSFGMPQNAGASAWQSLMGRPVFNDSNIEEIGTGNLVMLIGDFNFYGLVERSGLVVARNPYLYQANGQVGIFSQFRFGGAVLQAEAFQYATNA